MYCVTGSATEKNIRSIPIPAANSIAAQLSRLNSGFDCSGFTTWVFNKYGINLPRSSREQFQVGQQVAKTNLKKGDLVFFGSKRGISHVGIYLENGKFIHSASNGKDVQVSSLNEDYWRARYAGGRRVF